MNRASPWLSLGWSVLALWGCEGSGALDSAEGEADGAHGADAMRTVDSMQLGSGGRPSQDAAAGPADVRSGQDASTSDAHPVEVRDAITPDAAISDAESPDAATSDAATPDAATPDAALEPAPDAGDPGACNVDGVPGTCIDVADCPPDSHPTPGHCAGPRAIQCCTPGAPVECNAEVLVRPAALPDEAPGVGGCLPGMTRVEGADAPFCVDVYEAALLELTDGGAETPFSPFHNPVARVVRAVSVAGVVPQGYIDGLQAAAACEASGKRLCDNAEWLRACQGPDEQTYPYGDARMPGVCNDARAQHPAVQLFPDDPTPFDRIQDACINQLPDSVDVTGDNNGCISAEGALDLMGNLHEWTGDRDGTFRGGFYVDTVVNGPGCLYRTTAHDRAHWDYSTGFRCCAGL